ncbi:hypothetical protein JCM16358_22930 [Halanaerocella petrolearia]
MSQFLKGQAEAYCYMVNRGKPAATLAVQDRYLDEIKEFIEQENLLTYNEELYEGWQTLWIYKYPHILEVIKTLQQTPDSKFDHWILGKLFGYDEHSIHEFITTKID